MTHRHHAFREARHNASWTVGSTRNRREGAFADHGLGQVGAELPREGRLGGADTSAAGLRRVGDRFPAALAGPPQKIAAHVDRRVAAGPRLGTAGHRIERHRHDQPGAVAALDRSGRVPGHVHAADHDAHPRLVTVVLRHRTTTERRVAALVPRTVGLPRLVLVEHDSPAGNRPWRCQRHLARRVGGTGPDHPGEARILHHVGVDAVVLLREVGDSRIPGATIRVTQQRHGQHERARVRAGPDGRDISLVGGPTGVCGRADLHGRVARPGAADEHGQAQQGGGESTHAPSIASGRPGTSVRILRPP